MTLRNKLPFGIKTFRNYDTSGRSSEYRAVPRVGTFISVRFGPNREDIRRGNDASVVVEFRYFSLLNQKALSHLLATWPEKYNPRPSLLCHGAGVEGFATGCFFPISHSILLPWIQTSLSQNLILFSIRVNELFEPLILRKIGDGFLLFLKASSWDTYLWVTA